MAINNPLIPGDPYMYDLKWIVSKLKYLEANMLLKSDIDAIEEAIETLEGRIGTAEDNIISLMNAVGSLDDLVEDCIKYAANTPAIASYNVGDIVRTGGFVTPGDGGSMLYIVTSTGTSMSIQVDTDKYATPIIEDDYVTPEQFGASGNGTTDDTLPVRIACSFPRVRLSKTYLLTTPITIDHALEISGGTIKTSGSICAFNITGSNVKFEGVEFDLESGVVGINATAASEVTIDNCGVTGPYFVNAEGVENLIIRNCKGETLSSISGVSALSADGFVTIDECDGAVIRNCDFTVAGYSAIKVTDSDYISVSGNRIESSCRGVYVYNCDNAKVSENTITMSNGADIGGDSDVNATCSGIYSNACSEIEITENRLIQCTVIVTGYRRVLLLDNYIAKIDDDLHFAGGYCANLTGASVSGDYGLSLVSGNNLGRTLPGEPSTDSLYLADTTCVLATNLMNGENPDTGENVVIERPISPTPVDLEYEWQILDESDTWRVGVVDKFTNAVNIPENAIACLGEFKNGNDYSRAIIWRASNSLGRGYGRLTNGYGVDNSANFGGWGGYFDQNSPALNYNTIYYIYNNINGPLAPNFEIGMPGFGPVTFDGGYKIWALVEKNGTNEPEPPLWAKLHTLINGNDKVYNRSVTLAINETATIALPDNWKMVIFGTSVSTTGISFDGVLNQTAFDDLAILQPDWTAENKIEAAMCEKKNVIVHKSQADSSDGKRVVLCHIGHDVIAAPARFESLFISAKSESSVTIKNDSNSSGYTVYYMII